MNAVKELEKKDRYIEKSKKIICDLEEEIKGLRQLLDCAAANIAILVAESGGVRKISRQDVRNALGMYSLGAKCDGEGNYILEVQKEEKR